MLGFCMTLITEPDDKTKFARIYELYRLKMWYVANRVLADKYLAEDAVHDAFVGIAKNMKKIDDPESKATFIYVTTAAKNAAINIAKRNRTGNMVNIDDLYDLKDEYTEKVYKDMETAQLIKQVLADMSEIYRDVLYYFLVENMTEIEISDLLGRNINTVRQQVRRGKKIFAEKVRKGGLLL